MGFFKKGTKTIQQNTFSKLLLEERKGNHSPLLQGAMISSHCWHYCLTRLHAGECSKNALWEGFLALKSLCFMAGLTGAEKGPSGE